MAADAPLVSVLIPCFNARETVGEAVKSALEQTWERVEVRVVDDGSTDGSGEVLRSFEGDPRFHWVATENRGGNAARNLLLRQAEGTFVQFLDADDLLLPSKIERQVALLLEGADVVFCHYFEQAVGRADRRLVTLPPIDEDLLSYVIRHSIWTSVPLHRTAVLRRAGGFDETLSCCQEYELHTRLAFAAWRSARIVEEPLAVRRRMAGSVSSAENERRVFACTLDLLGTWRNTLDEQEGWGPGRREAVADTAWTTGRRLARRGATPQAREAFALAAAVAPGRRPPMTRAMGLLSRLLGPIAAERVRARLARVLGRE